MLAVPPKPGWQQAIAGFSPESVAKSEGGIMRRVYLAILLLASLLPPGLRAQVSVTTYHYDNSRSGQNTQETTLTPANVANQFGKLFSVPVSGYVYAQPLYLPKLAISGGTHNVLYVATEHDMLYALDADSGAILWQLSFLTSPNVSTVSSADVSCTNILPEIGITGTPVIDSTTGTIYLVVNTNESGVFVQRLHAIDVVSQAEKFGGPVVISATLNGESFDPLKNNQRSALLLENGHVVIAWGSHCDVQPYHGWLMSYRAGVLPTDTLSQEAVFSGSPNGGLSGIWMAGGGVAADASGNLFLATGNGTYDGLTDGDFGDSILKLGAPIGGGFSILDWFTPFNQLTLSNADRDLGSGGVLLLPDLSSGSAHQQLLTQMGKEGTIYLVDRSDMGQFCSSCTSQDTQIVQEVAGATNGVWGNPAYWNGSIYWGTPGYLSAFSFNANGSGLISTTPTSQTTTSVTFPGLQPTVSANGASNGIVWALDNSNYSPSCCQVLDAYDATNLANLLYSSASAASGGDVPGGAVKFSTPVVANGKVYVGSQGAVSAYGLFRAAAAPTISPAPGAYGASVKLALSDSLAGATIHCTTNGGAPLPSSPVCNSLTLEATSTVSAMATAPGYANSPIVTATYTVLSPSSTTTALSSSANPSFIHQTVTYTATVAGASGVPTGSVTFLNGKTTLATVALVKGQASYPATYSSAAKLSISASYSGDAENLASTSAVLTEVVGLAPTTLSLTASPNPSTPTEWITVSAAVGSSLGAPANGELVKFSLNGSLRGTSKLNAGVAKFSISPKPAASYSILASYGGDASHLSSSQTITQVVATGARAATTTTLTTSQTPAKLGQWITFKATVAAAAGKPPNGEIVTFSSSTRVLGTGKLSSGVATLPAHSLPAGSDAIKATYGGDSAYAASSGTVVQVITK
jgi:hypothetical protein